MNESLKEDKIVSSREEVALIVERVLAGDEAAYRQIVDKFKNRVFQITLRYTGNIGDAEDLSQEIFVRAYRFLDKFNPVYSFDRWLYTIAENLCFNYLKNKRKERKLLENYASELTEELTRVPDPTGLAGAREILVQVGLILPRLKPKYREAFFMRYYLDMSYEEIANTMNMTQMAIRQNVLRARRMILEMLGGS